MHDNNRRWFEECRATYPSHFAGARVLELGSMDPEKTIRRIFSGAAEYVGVDRGPLGDDEFYGVWRRVGAAACGVDVVCPATETSFEPGYFDTLVSASLLEHAPDWRDILRHNVRWLRQGGLALISFGAEGNNPHLPEPWAPVPQQEYLQHVSDLGFVVIDDFFEEDRYANKNIPGGYASVLRKL